MEYSIFYGISIIKKKLFQYQNNHRYSIHGGYEAFDELLMDS